MVSSIGENISLKKPIEVSGVLEQWLTQLEDQMVATLEAQLLECNKNGTFQLGVYSGQILCLSMDISYARSVSESIRDSSLPSLKTKLDTLLDKSTSSKSGLVGVNQNVMKSFIMDLIHQIAVLEDLIKKNVKNEDEWPWFKQLKYKLSKKKRTATIHMCKSAFDYSYEY